MQLHERCSIKVLFTERVRASRGVGRHRSRLRGTPQQAQMLGVTIASSMRSWRHDTAHKQLLICTEEQCSARSSSTAWGTHTMSAACTKSCPGACAAVSLMHVVLDISNNCKQLVAQPALLVLRRSCPDARSYQCHYVVRLLRRRSKYMEPANEAEMKASGQFYLAESIGTLWPCASKHAE